MKKSLIVLFTLCCALTAHSQEIGVNPPPLGGTVGGSISELFKAMPDSLLPYLTTNNRLDMLDFMEANMKAEVTNLLEGKSEMTALTPDSLSIRMNDVLRIDMTVRRGVPPCTSDTADCPYIRVVRTYQLNDRQAERVTDIYTASWHRLSSVTESTTLLRRDEDLLLEMINK